MGLAVEVAARNDRTETKRFKWLKKRPLRLKLQPVCLFFLPRRFSAAAGGTAAGTSNTPLHTQRTLEGREKKKEREEKKKGKVKNRYFFSLQTTFPPSFLNILS